MPSAVEYANLVSRVVALTATPWNERFESVPNTEKATAVLAECKAYAAANMGVAAATAYVKRVATAVNWIAAPYKEPWVAFVAGGPDKAPPVVALLQPAPSEPGLAVAIWDVLRSYTGPGMLYTYLVEGKVPTNGLMASIEAAMGATADKVVAVTGELWKPVAAVAAVVVALYLLKGRK